MSFPQLPFMLNGNKRKRDEPLLEYLRKLKNFPYLRKDSKKLIKRLNFGNGEKDLRILQKQLLELWHMILTDALLELKRKDTREWDEKNEKMETFFDEKSLGIDELQEVLKGFYEFESIMYGASPEHYRDHIAHSFKVWIIGHGILKECLNSELLMCEDESLKISQREWECMWAIVALCHDIGYPLSAVEKINQKARITLRKQGLKPEGDLCFTFSKQMMPFHDTIIKLMASKPVKVDLQNNMFLTHLQNKYYLKFLKSFDNLDHGIISSLLISTSLLYFLESDLLHDNCEKMSEEDARQFLIRREILRAISAHTCQDIYHIHFNTLSFLLYIVDEIQCWGRPTFEQLQNNHTNNIEGKARVIKFDSKNIKIIITTQDKWDDNKIKSINTQIEKLRKMLRLAVDTKELKKVSLHFEIKNQNAQNSSLELKDGAIKLEPAKAKKNR